MAPRRAHHKVAKLGLSAVVEQLLAEGYTYEQIAAELDRRGHKVGKSSVARYGASLEVKLENIRRLRETANAMSALIGESSAGGKPDTDVADMLLLVLQHSLMDKVGEDDLEVGDVAKLATAGAKVAMAKTAIERIKGERREAREKVWDEVTEEIKGLLSGSGLWPKVQSVLSEGRSRAEGAAA